MVTPNDVFEVLQRLEAKLKTMDAKLDYVVWITEQRSGGRPANAYRQTLLRQVEERRKRGASVAVACRETGIQQDTYRKWLKVMAVTPTQKSHSPDSSGSP